MQRWFQFATALLLVSVLLLTAIGHSHGSTSSVNQLGRGEHLELVDEKSYGGISSADPNNNRLPPQHSEGLPHSERGSIRSLGHRAADRKKTYRKVICFDNIENNPRTASLFELGTLNHFGAENLYIMEKYAHDLQVTCDHRILLVEHNLFTMHVRESV